MKYSGDAPVLKQLCKKRYVSLTKKLKSVWDYLLRTGPDAARQTGTHIHTNESQIKL